MSRGQEITLTSGRQADLPETSMRNEKVDAHDLYGRQELGVSAL
jgi:hypothetical protein